MTPVHVAKDGSPGIRAAIPEDVSQMAHLSVEGFRDSEIFRFCRPWYHLYPEDSVDSFAQFYQVQLADVRSVVVVAEDWAGTGSPGTSTAAELIIVGLASWRLPKSLAELEPAAAWPGSDDPQKARDACPRRVAAFNSICTQTQATFFRNKIILDKLVVHPKHRHRGWAGALVRYGLQLCKQNELSMGVIASHMGEQMYTRLGYETIGEMLVPAEAGADGFTQRVMVHSCLGPGILREERHAMAQILNMP